MHKRADLANYRRTNCWMHDLIQLFQSLLMLSLVAKDHGTQLRTVHTSISAKNIVPESLSQLDLNHGIAQQFVPHLICMDAHTSKTLQRLSHIALA